MLKIRVQVSSKILSVYPKFISSFLLSLTFLLLRFAVGGKDGGNCFSFEPESAAGYTDSLSHLELSGGINKMPWM